MKIYRILLFCCIPFLGSAQTMRYKGAPGGTLSFGQRTTFSTFNSGENERSALGFGGQFRIQLSERINTEWFMDYLPATNTHTRREDYHIGWSVFYYLVSPLDRKLVPYILAGHCFDYTNHTDLSNRDNGVQRWSSAAQAGLGTHCNLTERFDISLSSQYMIHLGTDVHSHVENGAVDFEQHKGGSLEGHLLFTVSLNYKFVDLWSRD